MNLTHRAKAYGVEYFQWLTILLQELSLVMDEDYLYELIDFARFSSPAIPPVEYDLLRRHFDCVRVLVPADSIMTSPRLLEEEDVIYFDRFLLHPVQINITFTKTQVTSKSDGLRPKSNGMFAFVSDILTMTIGNIHVSFSRILNRLTLQDAPIKLNALELQHANGHFNQLANLMFQFYSQEIVGQVICRFFLRYLTRSAAHHRRICRCAWQSRKIIQYRQFRRLRSFLRTPTRI